MVEIDDSKLDGSEEHGGLKSRIGFPTFANSLITCFLASWVILLMSIYIQDFINFIFHHSIQIDDLRPLNYDPKRGGIKKYMIVLFVLAFGELLLIATVILATKLFPIFYRFKGRTKLFLLWIKVFAWSSIFGIPLASSLTRVGFYYFFYYIGLKGPFIIGVTIAGLIASFFIGTSLNLDFMRTAYSRSFTGKKLKQYIFKLLVIWLPLVIVVYVNSRFFLVKYPEYYLYFFYPLPILLFGTLLAVPSAWIRIAKETGKETISIQYLLAAFACLIFLLFVRFLAK
jgi:hypothetical protein